ncbi:Nif11-like leader peptide family natural product precursor [Prochlorococcus sp. MIT 1223]|uniref:Nif11-like leader peptide family natural product precursor n=1 Tax=Prochlorococcus sp. MIT 1223 TaxID=3096217 RepID=UPI002A74F8C7|nr:Nif11-like leader peptide family natural product precursor [Prochlorococcus sp. MIT 1223]
MMDERYAKTHQLSVENLKAFLQEIQKNKELLKSVKEAATANEIAEIASNAGFEFSGEELKSVSNQNVSGVKVKKQDTSPSYSFGESGN